MSDLVQLMLAESVAEAEEIQAVLNEAGIDSELEPAVDHHPREIEDAPLKVLVAEADLETARGGRGAGRAGRARPDRVGGAARPAPDFGLVARRYDELRPVDAAWWELFELLVREGDLLARRVLEVGCGTGALAAALAERGASVWALDPSPEMLEVARGRVPRGVGLRQGRAEELPFRDGWFDRAVGRTVVHLLDRPRAFAELRRVLVPGGRLTLATFEPSHFRAYWLNDLFPSLAGIDLARFPDEDELRTELAAAGFAEVRAVRHRQVVATTREDALERIRGRWISTLQLLDEGEYRAGLERAESCLPASISSERHWLVVVAA